jgi:hypothetical protein
MVEMEAKELMVVEEEVVEQQVILAAQADQVVMV